MASKQKVVVAGGGVAGSLIAKGLELTADVTLIDPKTYFEIPYPQPRSIVEPSFADRTLLPYEEFLQNTKLVQSTAADVTAEEVVTASGERISYDYLVIATGTIYNGPPTKKERLEQFQENNKKVQDASSVLVVGGGPVGVELAAEIITDFPDKKVTLVTAGPRVLEFLGPAAATKTDKWLQKKGVKVIVNDRIDVSDNVAPPHFKTTKKVEVEADAHFVAVGKKIATEWIAASPYLKGALNEDGRVKSEPTTQIVGFPKLFAAGDVTDYKEIKQGFLAAKHADIVVANIKKLIKTPDDKKLKVYKPLDKPFGLVTLGRVDGVIHFPKMTFVGWIPGKLKSQDFFVGKSRTQLGLKASLY